MESLFLFLFFRGELNLDVTECTYDKTMAEDGWSDLDLTPLGKLRNE